MTTMLARNVPYREACRIARGHPGSVVARDGTAFSVEHREPAHPQPASSDVRSSVNRNQFKSTPRRRPARSTGLASPPPHFAADSCTFPPDH